MVELKALQGSGGKSGKKGRVAKEDKDSLRSRSMVRVIDAISEGEIAGLVDGAKSIYFDGVPLQNTNGEYNFANVKVELRNGTQGQEHIPAFSAVENEVVVGVEVTKATPVVRAITNANVDAVRVTLAIPQLSKQNTKNGDLNGSEVEIVIEIESGSGGYAEVKRDKIVGKTMSRYERSYRIPLAGTAPWNIRMRRLTDDSTSAALANKTIFASMTEIVEAKLSYPNTALVGIEISAEQFTSIPQRAYDVKLLKVLVPTNYDPVAHAYTGTWDGSFKVAWSDDPAWCYYDLVTNERYGLGKYVGDSGLDKWSLYKISKYCNEQVSDGFGGTEPRFTLNVYLQTRTDAYKLLSDLVSAFRGMMYWASNSVYLTQDAPVDPSYLYTNANVIDGTFTYSGSSAKARHTVALVSWNDLADLGRQKVEYVEDEDGIRKLGVIQTEVNAFGCTSRAQAHRLGKWILLSEQLETETVTFKTGLEGAMCRPGQIIRVGDGYRHAKRLGGRVVSATTGAVTLDSPVTLETGGDYRLSVLKADGTVHQSAVTNLSGTVSTLTLATHMTGVLPAGQATWVLTKLGTSADQLYRVITVAEQEDGAVYEVTALQHNPDKYALTDSSVKLGSFANASSGLPPGNGGSAGGGGQAFILPAPTGVKMEPVVWMDGMTAKIKVLVSWDWEAGVEWELEWRDASNNPVMVTGLTNALYEITDIQPGYYHARVRAKKTLVPFQPPYYSAWSYGASPYVNGVRPQDPTFLTANPGFLSIELHWGFPISPIQVGYTEVYGSRGGAAGPYELLHLATYPNDRWVHTNLLPSASWTYKIRFVSQHGVPGIYFPAAGVTASADFDVRDVLDEIKDSLLNSQFGQDLTSRIDDIQLPEIPELDDLYDRVNALRSDYNRDGELLLRSVVVDEQIKTGVANDFATVWDAYGVMQDGAALTATHVSLLETQVGETNARVLTEEVARSDGDSALASSISGLSARFDNFDGATGKTIEASIIDERTASIDRDSANATQISGLTARLDNFNAEAGKTLESFVVEEKSARVDGDSANASSISGLVTRLNTFDATGKPVGSLEARLANEETARVTADSANATSISQVSARLNDIDGVTLEQKFSATADSIDGLSAQYTLKVDNNGYVSGFGLASTPVNGVPVSTFAILSDNFVLINPNDGSPVVPFAVGPASEFGLDWSLIFGANKAADGATVGAPPGTLVGSSFAETIENNATSAKLAVDDLSSDGKFTPLEKLNVKREWDAIVSEKVTIDAQATTYAITTEKTAYGNAYNALSAYITPLLADLTVTSTIVGPTFRTNFANYYNARVTLLKKITDVAKADITTAQSAADTAATNAATANAELADISSDNKFTPVEKTSTKREWDVIVGEKATIEAQASTYGITTEKTTYTNAYNALSTYITPLLTSLTTTSTIDGPTFRLKFKTYYDARTALLKKVTDVAKTNTDAAATTASWTGVASRPTTLAGLNSTEGSKLGGIQAGATNGATIGTNLYGKMNASNITTWIENAAIGNALIGNAAVGTLSIAGNAVTVPQFVHYETAFSSGTYGPGYHPYAVCTDYIDSGGAPLIVMFSGEIAIQGTGYESMGTGAGSYMGIGIYVNGSAVYWRRHVSGNLGQTDGISVPSFSAQIWPPTGTNLIEVRAVHYIASSGNAVATASARRTMTILGVKR